MRRGAAAVLILFAVARAAAGWDASTSGTLVILPEDAGPPPVIQMHLWQRTTERIVGPMDEREAWAESDLGWSFTTTDRWSEAWPYFERSLAILEHQRPRDEFAIAIMKVRVAFNMPKIDRGLRGRDLLDAAYPVIAARESPNSETLEDLVSIRGSAALAARDYLAAMGHYGEVWDIMHRRGPQPPRREAYILGRVGAALWGLDAVEPYIAVTRMRLELLEAGEWARVEDIAEALLGTGRMELQRDQPAPALDCFSRALTVLEGAQSSSEQLARAQKWYVSAWRSVGFERMTMPELHRTLAIHLATYWDEPKTLLSTLDRIANACADAKEHQMAETVLRLLLVVRPQVDPSRRSDITWTRFRLANALAGRGWILEAIAEHRQTLAEREAIFGRFAPQVSRSCSTLGFMLYDCGKYAESAELRQRCIFIAERSNTWTPREIINACHNIAKVWAKSRDEERGLPLLHKAYQLALADPELEREYGYRLTYRMGRCYRRVQNVPEAQRCFRLAREYAKQCFGPRSIQVAWMLGWEALTLAGADHREAEVVALRLAQFGVLEDAASTDTARVIRSMMDVSAAYIRLGDPDEALRYLHKALAREESQRRRRLDLRVAIYQRIARIYGRMGNQREQARYMMFAREVTSQP